MCSPSIRLIADGDFPNLRDIVDYISSKIHKPLRDFHSNGSTCIATFCSVNDLESFISSDGTSHLQENFKLKTFLHPSYVASCTIRVPRCPLFWLSFSEEELKDEIVRNQNLKISSMYRDPQGKWLSLRLTTPTEATKILNSGLKAFSISISPYELQQEIFVPIIQCKKCYSLDHRSCLSTQKCSICSEDHFWKQCPNSNETPRCINCQGSHKAISHICPKIKSLKKSYRQARNNGNQNSKSYASTTQSHENNVKEENNNHSTVIINQNIAVLCAKIDNMTTLMTKILCAFDQASCPNPNQTISENKVTPQNDVLKTSFNAQLVSLTSNINEITNQHLLNDDPTPASYNEISVNKNSNGSDSKEMPFTLSPLSPLPIITKPKSISKNTSAKKLGPIKSSLRNKPNKNKE